MKRQLHLVFVCIVWVLFIPVSGTAQINYTENFEVEAHGWSDFDFYNETAAPCAGETSFAVNLYDGFFFGYTGETISPAVGTSNGGEITLSYSYKILDYDEELPSVPTENASYWGNFGMYYATSEGGPYTLIETISPENHVESVSCATRSVSFYTPADSEIYIRIFSELGNLESDFIIYFDNIQITQADPEQCTGMPSASSAVSTSQALCNGASATISLSPPYRLTGLSYQWQSSTDGISFTDIAGADSATYEATQESDTYYRAMVTCDASEEMVLSQAIEIVNTGLECPCTATFTDDIEPITSVEFAGINNQSSNVVNGSPGREDFTYLPPAEVTQGESYPITLQGNTAGDFTTYFTVFFDFNHNNSFDDEGESFEIGTIVDSDGIDETELTGTIMIPAAAATGLTYMRVFKLYFAYAEGACDGETEFGYGQVEDYLVNIAEGAMGAGSFTAQNFKYFPNPVVDVLNINYTKNITSAEVYNIVGQKVISKAVNQDKLQVDMSQLPAGSYTVRVGTNEGIKTLKIIKQ